MMMRAVANEELVRAFLGERDRRGVLLKSIQGQMVKNKFKIEGAKRAMSSFLEAMQGWIR